MHRIKTKNKMNIPSQQTISTTLIASAAWSLTSCTNNADAFTKGVHTGYLAKRTASPLFQNLKSANVGLQKISGDTKYELGISIGEIKTGTESNLGTNKESSTTTHETIELSTKISSKDDSLGMAKIYFYDPLIMEKRNGNYVVKTYNTGYVNFGLTAK